MGSYQSKNTQTEIYSIYLMASLNHLLCATILCTTLLISPICCYAQSKQQPQRKLLFVFGDSLFDPGNNQYLNGSKKSPATSWPYGMNFNNHSTGRLSDGRLVPDFIAQFAKLHMEPPFLEPGANFTDGANLASAGGAVLDNRASADGVMNLGVQLTNFKKVVNLLEQKEGEKEAKKILMRSVFLFSLGGNDYFSYNTDNPNATRAQQKAYMHMVIGNLTNGIKEIYNIGGRKFGFQNVGPLGCQPMILSMFYTQLKGDCAENFLMHANMHNKALSIALKKFESRLPGFKHALFNFNHELGDRIKNPTKYGFKEGKVACCGSGVYNANKCGGGDNGTLPYKLCSNPSEYVFFDGGHNTERTNNQLANLLWSGPPSVTGPYNMKQLFELP